MANARKQLLKFGLVGLTSFVALVATAAIATLQPKPTLQAFGEQQSIGSGTIRTFVTLDNQRNPVAIGVTFTEDTLSDLPSTPVEYELSLPFEASASAYR